MTHRSVRSVAKAMAVAAALVLVAADAEARTGGGRSFGSRGSNSYSAPPVTNTAPRQAQPLPGPGYSMPPRTGPMGQASQPGRFGGFLGGLGAGLLGAGLIGMMFGGGFFSGLGSLTGFLGLVLQLGLIFLLVRFAMNWFRRRQTQPAMGSAGYQRAPMQPDWTPAGTTGGASGGMAAGMASPRMDAPVATEKLEIGGADFDRFEAMLAEIQQAYSHGDRVALARLVTPEMGNELNRELDDLARRGLVNKLSGVKLLQGDLSEAWREPGAEYATVAMRYAIIDAMVEKASGRVVEGDPANAVEATEIWTFRREPGEGPQGWALSAIQQV